MVVISHLLDSGLMIDNWNMYFSLRQGSFHIVFVVITVHFPEHTLPSCDQAAPRCVCLSFMTQELSLLFDQMAISQQEDVRGQSRRLQCARSPRRSPSDQIRSEETGSELRDYLALLARERCGVAGYLDRGVLWQLLSEVHISVWRKGKKPVLGRFRGPA